MSESQFKFRRTDDEEPLYLDRKPRSDDRAGASAGLYLDRAPERKPRRESRPFPLIIASVIVFLLAAGVAAFVLEPPAVLRDWVASVTGRTAAAPEATPPAPQTAEVEAAPPVPPAEDAAALAAQEAAAAAEAPTESAQPPPEPKAVEPAPKAAAHKAKPKPAAKKATAKAKPPAKKITPPPPKKKGLDLDALERSLN